MLSNLQKLSIFWDESTIYVLVYGVYALLVCAAVLCVEIRLQKGAGGEKAGLAFSNSVVAILATLLFAASLLATGWYPNYFGGEIGAFVVALAITFLVLYFTKTGFVRRYALNYDSSRVPALAVSALLVAPFTLASIFIYLLASGMRN
jgi:hypothetical protein